MTHIPVLLHEVLTGLQLQPNDNAIDGTVGGGGHTRALLDASAPSGTVIGFDRDRASLLLATEALIDQGKRFIPIHDSYAHIQEHAERINAYQPIKAILLDLGMSSLQLDAAHRGFSFKSPDAPLDMRFDQTHGMTAAGLLNSYPAEKLMSVFTSYAEEPRAKPLAHAIVQRRHTHAFQTVGDFMEIIEAVIPFRHGRAHHPAARLFQAVRIAVNHELDHLNQFLPQALELLTPGGRLAIIAFHSVEDRIVKRYFKSVTTDCICPPELPECRCSHRATATRVTRKALQPTEAEAAQNPRARSATLRIIQKI